MEATKYFLNKIIVWIDEHIIHSVIGVFFVIIGFLQPISHIINLVIFLTLIDFCVGVYVAKRLKVGIESRKMWRTAEKLVFEVVLLLSLFIFDYLGDCGDYYTILGWWFAGVEIYSMVESMAKINKFFERIKVFIEGIIEEKTGFKFNENEE